MNMDMDAARAAALQASEPRVRTRDWITLGLLVFGPFVFGLGWLVGVWLLWTSNRWTAVWKIAGTVAWPVGWIAAMCCEFIQPPVWVSTLVGAVIAIAVYVALIKEARV